MKIQGWIPASLLVSLALLLTVGVGRAEFVEVDDFEELQLGPISGQEGWVARSDSSTVALDPIGGDNQVLSVITESTHLHREMLLLNDTIRMVFLRFRFDSQISCSFGMSESTYPSQFGHFDPELSQTSATSELRINDGGQYDVISVLESDTWYNCWLLIDNFADEAQIWLHSRPGQSATWEDQLDSEGQTIFAFRNITAGDLRTFYIKTGGGNGVAGPLYIDDIYMEDSNALNFGNPAAGSTAAGEIETPVAIALDPAFPNPFNPHTSLRFTLPAAMDVLLTVHDASGRRVRDLAVGNHDAGPFTVTWDGRDAGGRELASGIYFAALRAGDFTATRKLVLLR